jgi:hypothetical protein
MDYVFKDDLDETVDEEYKGKEDGFSAMVSEDEKDGEKYYSDDSEDIPSKEGNNFHNFCEHRCA